VSFARDHLIPLTDEGLGNSAYLADLGGGRALAVDASRDLRALHQAAAGPKNWPAPSTGRCAGWPRCPARPRSGRRMGRVILLRSARRRAHHHDRRREGGQRAAGRLDEDAFARLLLAGLGSYPAYFGRLAEINRKGPLTDRQRFRWNMDPRPAQKIMGMPIDPEGDISYRLSMDQISTLAARLHVDLRRQASAVCRGAACAEGRAAA